MKKLMIIMLALLAFTLLSAVEIQYWNGITHFTRVPWAFVSGGNNYTYTTIGTDFVPAGACDLNGIYFMIYGATQVGNLDVACSIWEVDENTGLPTGMFPLYTEVIPYASLTLYPNFHYWDLSAQNLSFPAGQEFFFTFAAPMGVPGSTYTCPLLDNSVWGQSYRYFSVHPTGAGWYPYAGEYTHVADVTYTSAFRDMSADVLYFSGDFFLQQNEEIIFEADVSNLSDEDATRVTADIYLHLYHAADLNTPILTQLIPGEVFAFEETKHYIFDPITFTDQGEYCVAVKVDMAGDMVSTNNAIYLEQQVVVLPDLLDYDDGVGETAHAFYVAGSGWANEFWYAEPVKLTNVGFNMRDATWPTGALPFLQYKIYADDGAGAPGAVLYDSGVVGCTLGAWNNYDVSAQNINIPADTHFYVAYHQVGDYLAGAPGLLGDMNMPFTGWLTSWAYYYDSGTSTWVWETPNATDEDMMIRCGVEAGVAGIDAPIISIMLDGGYPTIYWAEVVGAQSYNLYGSVDPFAPLPWDTIETGIQDLGYMYNGGEPYKFFYVRASTELDGRRITNNQYARGTRTVDPAFQPKLLLERPIISEK